jgi:proteasome assembly chaperone (PAC2) family protein
MDVIRRFSKPVLRRPRAVISFEGWNDAGEAASGAAEYLLTSSRASEPFAVIDPEEFYDFQVRRPQVSIDAGGTRSLTWPMTRFYALEMASGDRDLVVVLGEEPSFRWRTYARYLTQVLTEVDVEAVVLLGAFAGQVAHTRPVPVIGVATDPALVDRHRLLHSTYEGPTGILAVLQEACREVGLPAISLWAAAPHYLASNPNPKASLALASKTAEILGFDLDTTSLRSTTDEFERQVAEAMESSGELAEYVADLESDLDHGIDAVDPQAEADLVGEIESFLRSQD